LELNVKTTCRTKRIHFPNTKIENDFVKIIYKELEAYQRMENERKCLFDLPDFDIETSFKFIDTDKNGQISISQLSKFIRYYHTINDKDIKTIFNMICIDRNIIK
jgi:Ca2+-binding EF-hand superfamily protein